MLIIYIYAKLHDLKAIYEDMSTLEKVIKDLEFENEDIIRQIKDEIEQIDGIQKDTAEKSLTNTKLEKDIEIANKNTKSLHGQFKQNKEIIESLKSATILLERHCVDLQNSFKLRTDEANQERQEHQKVIDSYTEKWLSYEAEYEKKVLAQEARALKLEAANLESEEKDILQQKKELIKQIKNHDNHKGAYITQKKEAIDFIIELAKCKAGTYDVLKKLYAVEKDKREIQYQLDEESVLLEDLKMQLEKATEQAVVRAEENSSQQQAEEIESHATTKEPPKEPPKVPKFSALQPFQLPKFSFSKLSQVPKMSQLPKIPIFSPSPRVNSKVETIESPHRQQYLSQQQQQQQHQQQQHQQQTPQPHQSGQYGERDETEQPKQFESSTNPIDVDMRESDNGGNGDEGCVYQIPLEQSNKEFFQQLSVDSTESAYPSPKTPSSVKFSPGQHAEQLKMLKQSPAERLRQGRPMFQNADDQNTMEYDVNENEFQSSFSNQAQFMGFVQDKPADMKELSPEVNTGDNPMMMFPVISSNGKIKVCVDNNNVAFVADKRCDASKAFSFDTPQSTTCGPSQANRDSVFNFDFNDTSAEQTGHKSAFDFNTEGDNNHSDFTMESSEFHFGMDGHSDNSSMFDFAIRNKESASTGSAQIFNFGDPSVTSPVNDQTSAGFLFDLSNTDTSPVTSNNQFSFTF